MYGVVNMKMEPFVSCWFVASGCNARTTMVQTAKLLGIEPRSGAKPDLFNRVFNRNCE